MSKNSRLLQEALKTAQGLYKSGVIDCERMQEYETMCAPVRKFTGEDVKNLRSNMNLSPTVLAKLINTTTATVHAWEAGKKNPDGQSCKLLAILSRKGIEALF